RSGILVDFTEREEEGILRRRRRGRFDGAFQPVDRLALLPLRSEEARRVELGRGGNFGLPVPGRAGEGVGGVGTLPPGGENQVRGLARGRAGVVRGAFQVVFGFPVPGGRIGESLRGGGGRRPARAGGG